jgi:hypothetical protein
VCVWRGREEGGGRGRASERKIKLWSRMRGEIKEEKFIEWEAEGTLADG